MSSTRQVSVALSSELFDMVTDAVASGEFASTSELIGEALREWRLRQPSHVSEIELLRQAWQAGIASGPGRPVDFDAVKRKGRDRLAAAKR